MAYDVEKVRSRFPALAAGTRTSTAPAARRCRARWRDAVAATLELADRQPGPVPPPSGAPTRSCSAPARRSADLLGADPGGVVFGRSATQLTFDLARTLAADWGPGDEVVVTRLDHDANIRPWVQAAERSGATVRWADFDPATGELDASTSRRCSPTAPGWWPSPARPT